VAHFGVNMLVCISASEELEASVVVVVELSVPSPAQASSVTAMATAMSPFKRAGFDMAAGNLWPHREGFKRRCA